MKKKPELKFCKVCEKKRNAYLKTGKGILHICKECDKMVENYVKKTPVDKCECHELWCTDPATGKRSRVG